MIQVKHDIKAKLTQSSTGAGGGEGARNYIQVFANSLVASVLILIHTWQAFKQGVYHDDKLCFQRGADVLVIGIVAYAEILSAQIKVELTEYSNYAAVAADTLSSELGILSKSKPRLITAPWRVVPPGTNGGVTMAGLGAGLLGAGLIAATSTLLLPFCKDWDVSQKTQFTLATTLAGFSGTLLDSLLGALFQASVVDVHSGKIVEGEGGRKVLIHSSDPLHLHSPAKVRSEVSGYQEGKEAVAKSSGVDPLMKTTKQMQAAGASGTEAADGHHESRKIAVGKDILDNNAVNLLMAALVSFGSMMVACAVWDLPFDIVVSL